MTIPTVSITDRNETKYLVGCKFVATQSPRNSTTLDFTFEATEELFKARRAYCCNVPIPVQDFIEASKIIDAAIHAHRNGGAR